MPHILFTYKVIVLTQQFEFKMYSNKSSVSPFVTGGESGPVGNSPGTTSTHNKGFLHDRWVHYNFNGI